MPGQTGVQGAELQNKKVKTLIATNRLLVHICCSAVVHE